MALTVAFDTHKFVRKLKGAGFNDQQAEALTDAVQESHASLDVATKRDIDSLRHEIGDLRKDMDAKLVEVKFELLKWMIGLAIAQTSLWIALKLFPIGS